MTTEVRAARVDADALRGQIRDKYTDVALTPDKGFHFHTGRPRPACWAMTIRAA